MKRFLIYLALLPLLAACGGGGGYTPKPTAYLRISLPEPSYVAYDTLPLPFLFEKNAVATVSWKKNERGDKWVDLLYPDYGGVVFLSYKSLGSRKELAKAIDDSYSLLKTHYGVASGIDEQQFVNPEGHVYASTFRLGGRNVASTYQFWATDSARHFLHGSFYLDRAPNNDSLQPLITYIQQDLDHLLESLRWR